MDSVFKRFLAQLFSFFPPLFFLIIALYAALVLSVINWGIPQPAAGKPSPAAIPRVFTYHMDEWHQLKAVIGLAREGSPNIPGAAHGPVLFFLLIGASLAPWLISGVVNAFALSSPLTQLATQQHLFWLLRSTTLLYGIGTLGLWWALLQKLPQLNPALQPQRKRQNKHQLEVERTKLLILSLFTFVPQWLLFSTYFKYDIALIFFLVGSLYALVSYLQNPTPRHFLLAGGVVALTLASKISALPLIPLYIGAFFLAQRPYRTRHPWTYWRKRLPLLIQGLSLVVLLFAVLGVPDLLLGRGDYTEFFTSNLLENPTLTASYKLEMPYGLFILTQLLPSQVGWGVYSLALIGLGSSLRRFWLRRQWKQWRKNAVAALFLIGFLLFVASLLPLRLFATGNRSLVLLPFWLYFALQTFQALERRLGGFIQPPWHWALLTVVVVAIQLTQSLAWLSIKWLPDPRATSAAWLQTQLPAGSTIGLEAIPIYQMVPDTVLYEYYAVEYQYPVDTRYRYELVDKNTQQFPKYVLVTNTQVADRRLISDKKLLLRALAQQDYHPLLTFELNRQPIDWFVSTLSFALAPQLVPAPTDITLFTHAEDVADVAY